MSGFNKVVNSYDLLKNDYELVGFTDNSEKLINNYNEAFSIFESEYEI